MIAAPTSVMVEHVDDARFGRRLRILDSEPRQDVNDSSVQIQNALFRLHHSQRRSEGFRDGGRYERLCQR